ncbi:MAG: M14 family zinc carboxypeptidase [Gemmatimonadales bacterium]
MATRLLSLALLFGLASPLPAQAFDFYTRGPYRPAVPRPEQITGYAAGEQHTMYAVLQRYLDTLLATAPDRVRAETWGSTVEHRPYRALVISDPANLARVDEIRAAIAELVDPRKTSAARAALVAERQPIIVLFQYSVHGDEPAGFEAAMQVAYQMLAGEDSVTKHILKNVVLVLNPSANPDGHERFAAWYNSVAIGADHPWAFEQIQPWSITGRYNHYRFDMNRDLVAQSQPEARIMMDGILRWHPQVFVDHHSTTQTYFFPPVAPAVNQNLPAQTTRWFETFGRGNAAAFDRHGWQYFVRGVFDFFYVGYWDEWATFHGATGMTYETDGGPEFNQRRDDGTISTFRDGIAHHFVASLATLETAAQHRQARLLDYYAFRKSALDEAAADRMKRIVLVPGTNAREATHLVGLLLRNGIEVSRLTGPGTATQAHSYLGGAAGRRSFPAGSYVVDLVQPQRRLARALLEPNAVLDRPFVDEQIARFNRNRRRGEDAEKEDYGFYDVTAWSLPLAFNLEAYWTEDAGPLPTRAVTDTVLPPPTAPGPARSAYVFVNDDPGAARLTLALQREGFNVAIATQALRADGRDFPRGTFVVRSQRNPASLPDRVTALARSLGVTVTAVQSAFADTGSVGTGSDAVVSLHAPNILVGVGDGIAETSYGWLWHFLVRDLGAPFTPVPLRWIGSLEDLSRFNVLLIPDGSGGRMRRELGDGGIAKLKAWVQSGGVLIGIGGAGDLVSDKTVGLSTITAVGADSGKADSTIQADAPPLLSPTAPARDKPEWLPGAIFRATLDRSHWLTVGYEQHALPVFLDGATFWKPSRGGASPIAFTSDSLVLSGFTWPGNTERLLKGTAWAVVENQGEGRVVLFLGDPLFRASWRGTARLVSNAILVGPNRR